jgi:hypothetical protein
MAIAVQQRHPVAHWPLVLGVLRRLEVASLIDTLIPPHPAHVLSTGRGGDGGLPLRVGMRDGNRSDRVETPRAIEECLAVGLDGVRGIVADSKA